MSSNTIYTCQFCKKILSTSAKICDSSIKFVTICHRPPEWTLSGDKSEDYHFCGKCYKEFLAILRKRSSEGVCGICTFAYCCTEKEDDECEYVNEPPVRKFWNFWRPK